jgi:hypothetical protein
MANLSNIITPTNVLTATNTATLTNKTVAFANNTFTGALAAANGGTGVTSPGAAGNVLTSNGTAWTSAAAPAAGMELLATVTASNSATVDLSFSGAYKNYVVIFGNLVPVNNGANFRFQLTTDSFSTVDEFTTRLALTNVGGNVGNSATITNALSNTASSGAVGVINFPDPKTVLGTSGKAYFGSAVSPNSPDFTGQSVTQTPIGYTTNTAINGVRGRFNSGNISTGTFYVYGVI